MPGVTESSPPPTNVWRDDFLPGGAVATSAVVTNYDADGNVEWIDEGNPLKGQSPRAFEDWQLEKDEERLRIEINRLIESARPDPALLALKRSRLKQVREEMKRRFSPPTTDATMPKQVNLPAGPEGKAGAINKNRAAEGKAFQPSPELAAKFRKQFEEVLKSPQPILGSEI